MSVQAVIYSRLSTHAGLSALVSTRIYPDVVPAETANPVVRFEVLSDLPVHSMGTTSGMREVSISVSSWEDNYDDSLAVSAQVVNALSRYSDDATAPVVHDTIHEIGRSLYEEQLNLFRFINDFKLIITE